MGWLVRLLLSLIHQLFAAASQLICALTAWRRPLTPTSHVACLSVS